ncbi:putative ribonuclease H protein [Hordeum vulgare]|nr:putative ribonuclease H protein [Hordeum vulgare]
MGGNRKSNASTAEAVLLKALGFDSDDVVVSEDALGQLQGIHGGKCAVSWDHVCRPKRQGGLGVVDLYRRGIALRLRWEWLRHTDGSRPWQGLNLFPDKQVAQAFGSMVKWSLGSGSQILFWKDGWINGATIKEIAPLVLARVRTQVANRRFARDALQMHACTNDIVGDMCIESLSQFIALWEILIEVETDPGSEDRPIWVWNVDGTYTASSAYRMLCEGDGAAIALVPNSA